MDTIWEELITKFTHLGGVIENVQQKEGKNGRGIFAINKSEKSRIFVPSNLLINIDDIEERNGQLFINDISNYDSEIREFFSFYEENFSWGNGGRKTCELFEKNLFILPSAVKELIKEYLLIDLDIRYKGNWDELILKQFLNSRKFFFSGKEKIAPVLELVNHEVKSLPYIRSEKGLSTPDYDPKDGEITHSYGYRSPIKRLFDYGFYCEESIIFSYPFRLQIDNYGNFLVCNGSEIIDDSMLSISNEKQTCIQGLPIADINIPTLPKEYLMELIKKNSLKVSYDHLFAEIKNLNIKKRNILSKEIKNVDSYSAQLIKKTLEYELKAINNNC
tara:strand:- start:811 stop:1806 length:996 start_codon:yes stop_codon:yes gene_type:complete